MITRAGPGGEGSVLSACARDVFGAAIASDLAVYGAASQEASFFVITDGEGGVHGALSFCPCRSVLTYDGEGDTEEIGLFLGRDRDGLLLSGGNARLLNVPSPGILMSSAGAANAAPGTEVTPVTGETLSKVFELTAGVFGIAGAARDEKYRTLSYKFRHGLARGFAVFRDGEAVSSALTDGEYGSFALIEGVCTAEAERRQGLAKAVLAALTAELQKAGREPQILVKDANLVPFYTTVGFTVV